MTEFNVEPDAELIRVTLTVGLSPTRQIGFETVASQDIDPAAFDRLADKITRVADRLQAKVELVEHEKQIRILNQSLKVAVKADVERIEQYRNENRAKSSGGSAARQERLTQAQQANLDQIKQEIAALRDQIAMREESARLCRVLIFGDAEPLAVAAE